MTADLVFLTRDGCANTGRMRGELDTALRGLGQPTTYQVLDLEQLPVSDTRRGYPTPTLLYKGKDLFGLPAPTPPLPDPT